MSKLETLLYMISTVILDRFFFSSDGSFLPGRSLEMNRFAVCPLCLCRLVKPNASFLKAHDHDEHEGIKSALNWNDSVKINKRISA